MLTLERQIRTTRNRVEYLATDVGVWSAAPAEVLKSSDDREDLQELVDTVVAAFHRIVRLDSSYQHEVLSGGRVWDDQTDREIESLLRVWIRAAKALIPLCESADLPASPMSPGLRELQDLHRQAVAMLTPDDEYFGAGLDDLRDQALGDNRAGRTENMPEMSA